MIDTRQIRVGNIVLYQGKYHRWQENDFLDKDIRINGEYVKLWREIIEKCGFKARSGSGVHKLTIAYGDTDYPCTLQRTGDGVQICRSGIGAITACMESLHQLQNLYFALTGNELKITL